MSEDEVRESVITLPVTYELGLSSLSTVLRILRGAIMVFVRMLKEQWMLVSGRGKD